MNTVRINGQDYTSSLSDAEIAFMGNFSLPTTAQTLSGAIAEHENDISELNSNLVGSDTIITNGVNIYVNNNKNVVTIQFRGQLGKTATNGSTTNLDVTVPEGKRPLNATYGVLGAGGSTNAFMLVGITTSGAIQIYNHSGSNQNYGFGQITYVI